MSRTIDNNGIGSLYATFYTRSEDNIGVLSYDDVGKAVDLFDNNTVDLIDSDKVFGLLEHVAGNLCTVAIKGIMRFPINDPSEKDFPVLGLGVGCTSEGTVVYSKNGTGRVLNINWENKTCDVLI